MSYCDCLCLSPCSCPLQKQDTGSALCPSTPVQNPASQRRRFNRQMASPLLRGNERSVNPVFNIGSSFWLSQSNAVAEQLQACSLESMLNLQDQLPPSPTSGRRTPESPNPNSSMVPSQSSEMILPIGMQYEHVLFRETLMPYPVTSIFAIMGISGEFIRILRNRLEFFDIADSFGDQLALARAELRGMKQDPMLTLRILEPSGGVAIKLMNVFLSMNSEVFYIDFRCHRYLLSITVVGPISC